MNPIPQTAGEEITTAINALIYASDRMRNWDDPEIRDLFERIRKLQKVDARDAFVRFSALAAVCGRVDDVLEYGRKALQLPGEAETKHEYWVNLGNIGLYSEAHKISSWLLEPRRHFFPRIWERAVSTGQVLGVWDRVREAKRAFSDLEQTDFSALQRAAEVMTERKLGDSQIASVFDLMGEVQRSHRTMFAGQLAATMKALRPPEEPSYLYFSMPIDASTSEIHAMNRELAALVVKKLPHGAFPDGLVTSFTRAPAVELRAAA